MKMISSAYMKMSSASNHSGFSFALMMRMVESIAKNGFDKFAEQTLANVINNLPSIIEFRN